MTGGRAFIIMGVSGSGKTTAGAMIAKRLGAPFIEGDRFHPQANIYKMASGVPLNDDDRRPWLMAIGVAIAELAVHDAPVVAACSALKRSYRDMLREQAKTDMLFVYLAGSRELIGERMKKREGHFFPAKLLDSQFATLEPPEPDERHIVADLRLPVAEMVDAVMAQLAAM